MTLTKNAVLSTSSFKLSV